MGSSSQTIDPIVLIRRIALQPLIRHPGVGFAYNQTSYGVFGLLVAHLTGQSYTDWLAQQLFEPLDMKSAIFGDSFAIVPGRPPAAYILEGGQLRNTFYRFSAHHYPAAGLNASILDIARFLVALDHGQVLHPTNLIRLWTAEQLADGASVPYGLGWTVGTSCGQVVVGHEGGGAAWITHMPDERLSIAVLCNLNGARADEIQYGVANLVLSNTEGKV